MVIIVEDSIGFKYSNSSTYTHHLKKSIIRKSKYIAFVNMVCPTRNGNNGGGFDWFQIFELEHVYTSS